MNTMLVVAAALSFTKPEIVTATFESAADAQKAQIAVAPIYGGKKLAFTSRWDDSAPAHVERSEMFKRVGMQPMFFLNGDKGFVKDLLPKIKANGGRFGHHTVSHPFLMESGVNRMFREVMNEKIIVETGADMPNTSFVIPFNWSCSLEPGRAAKLAKILVNAGIFVSSDWPLEATEQPPSEWMPGNTFGANDSAPDEKRYWQGVADGIAAVEKNPDYPKITFGIHSWCKPDGVLKQEQWLKKTIADHPEFWVTDDAHYGAYRYEFWHFEAKKLGVKGNTATFEVQRHDPAYLGEVQPLTYVFGDVKAVKVEVKDGFDAVTAMPEKIDVMKDGVSAKFPGLKLAVSVDEAKGALAYKFEGDAKIVQVVVNPAPMWSEGRILAQEAEKSVSLGERNTLADYQEGDHLYVVQVDFIKDGKRGRLYATETVDGAKAKVGGTPRDCTLVMGPMDGDHYDEAKWVALSVPEATLPNLGDRIDQYWYSMADKQRCGFSAAAYIPWDASVPADFKEAMKTATPKDRPFFLAAVDFVCESDGEKDLLVNRAKWEKTKFYLNGKLYDAKGGEFKVPVKKGLNRLIYVWEWFQPWIPKAFLLSVCDDKSVDKAVKFVKPKTETRECVFESGGWTVEFKPDGQPRSPLYAGKKIVEGFGYENCKSLTKKTCAVKPVYKRTADSLDCTMDCPIGTASDDYAYRTTYRVTKDAISFEGMIQVKEGVTWKGANACSAIYAPIAFYTANTLTITDAKGAEKTIDYPKEFDAKTCKLPAFKTLSNGEWTIEFDGAQLMNFTDRRQWNNPMSAMQICPDGCCQWGGKVSDGTAYTWKWTIRHN